MSQPEPPTPLRNADFRSLLASLPRPVKPPPSSTSSSSSALPPPPKSTKRLEHYQRYLAKQAARQQPLPSDESKSAAAAPPRPTHRDRARERRFDANPDYALALPSSVSSLSAEATKFLGGDDEHTHLVKGLDYALLRKKKEEEERKEQEKLDELLHHELIQPSTTVNSSTEPVFHSPLARSLYHLLHRPATTPSDLFLPGRLSYSITLPPPSPFPLLPLALSAPPPHSAALLASLNELPISVLVAKDDLVLGGRGVSGFVSPAILRQVTKAMAKKRERDNTKKKKRNTGEKKVPVSDEEEKDGAEGGRPVSLEERRKRLMEEDDDDIFGDATAPLPCAPTVTPPPPTISPFKPAAPTSKYFQTTETLPFATLPVFPATDDATVHTSSSVAPLASLSPPSSSVGPSRSLSSFHDEYDDLYPDAAISFSGHFAGDEDSDDEAEAVKEKQRIKDEKMSNKRGRGRRGGEETEMRKEEKRREAKIDSQLAGVTDLLKKEAGKLSLDRFEKEGAAEAAAKRHKIG